jgi:MFS family permease
MKKTVRSYFALQGTTAFGISFISAFYVTFLLTKGLNLFEVNLVNFFFWTTLFVCELPTGAFADVFSRKLSFVLSCLLFGAGMVVYGFVNSFWGFVVAEMISAVGQTFANGAFQAWLIDRLQHQGYTGSFSEIFARKQQINGGVGIVSAILGAFLGSINMSLPWFFGGGVMIAAGCAAMVYMREENEFAHAKFSFSAGIRRMYEVVVSSVAYSRKNSAVRFILIMTAVHFFAIQAPNMQWQPLFHEYLVSQTSLGYVKGGISLGLMAGAALASIFLRLVAHERKGIVWVQISIGIGIACTVLPQSFVPALTVFLLHEIPRGLLDPLKESYLHDNIPQDRRATIASCDSISHHIGGMIGLLASGALAQYVSLPAAWIVSGLVLVISALLLIRNGHTA